jgi:membrane protein
VLTLAPLLIGASLSLTSWLVGLSMGNEKLVSPFGIVVLRALPILFATLAFTLLFRLVPNRHVPRAHALIGALVAAMVFETTSRVFGYFVSHFPTYTLVYGAFASVPIFLMWIYLSWLTILFGAVIAATLSHWRTPSVQDLAPGTQLLNAMRVLQIMVSGLQNGSVSTLQELSKSLRLGYDMLEKILDELSSVNMVRKVEGNGWVLVRDANHIHVAELLRLFVLNPDILPTGKKDDPLQHWLVDRAGKFEQSTDITLQELFARQAS